MRRIIILLLVALLVTAGCSSTETKTKVDLEIEKSEALLPPDTANRDIILYEVKKGYLTAKEIDIYLKAKATFEKYIRDDGEYNPEKHDTKVFKEMAQSYSVQEREVQDIYWKVDKLTAGVETPEPQKLDSSNTPVNIEINKVVFNKNKQLEVTVTNKTDIQGSLPSINLTCNLYKGGSRVGDQGIWIESLGNGTKTFTSFKISEDFDSYEIIAYINIEDMKDNNLKSTVQESNDRGETIIPVLKMPITKL